MMKILDYTSGYLNVSMVSYLEVEIKQNEDGIYNIYLNSPEKSVFLFSCEREKEASKFKELFSKYLMNYVKNPEEKYMHIFFLIHLVVDNLLKRRD